MTQTKTDENRPESITDTLAATLAQLTSDQIRFVIARQEFTKDKEAAIECKISPNTVKDWKYKGAPIDEAVRLMASDGVVVASELRRRNLAKAMAVKVKGLDSDKEGTRQSVATEIIEWEMGKANQGVDVTTKGESLNEGQRHDKEAHARAMVSILDAFGTGLLRPDSDESDAMDAEQRTASGGGVLPS